MQYVDMFDSFIWNVACMYACIMAEYVVFVALEGVFLVDFSARNLNFSSTELTTKLNETLARCEEELHKVEEISKS